MKSIVAVLLAFLVLPTPSFSADAKNGAVLARQCTVCHGKNGLANDPEVANLAGQSAFYIEKSLKAFRKGEREDRRMTLIAKNLSDEDIKDLAAWFSSFEVTVKVPELGSDTSATDSSKAPAESDDEAVEVAAEAAASDVTNGEKIYKKTCKKCHGPTAKGLASYPKLRDHTVEYLADRLERYRKGEKLGPNSPLMAPNARGLSDTDILDVATFIASIE